MTGERWFDDVDWWTDPRLAYAKGLADGAAMEAARRDVIDDQVHRKTVKNVIDFMKIADRRAEADRPGPRPGDYPGRGADHPSLRVIEGGAA